MSDTQLTVIVLLGVAGLTVAIVAAGTRKLRRDGERITAAIASIGDRVISFDGFGRNGNRSVLFISRDGDLRQAYAAVSWRRGVVLEDEKSFQQYFLEKEGRSPRSSPDDDSPPDDRSLLRALKKVTASAKLPGMSAYKRMLLPLANGSQSTIEIKEDAPPTAQANSAPFAAILQCVEWQAEEDLSRGSGTLDLVTYERPLPVSWRIEGTRPHRTLVLTAIPPPPVAATPASAQI